MKSEKMDITESAGDKMPGTVPMDIQLSTVAPASSDQSPSLPPYHNLKGDTGSGSSSKFNSGSTSEDDIVYGELIVLGYMHILFY